MLDSSSTDFNQVPETVLGSMDKQIDDMGSFWSSDGSLGKNDTEYLLMSSNLLENQIFLLDRIDLKCFIEPSHPYPHNIYYSNKVVISIG